DAHPKPDSVTYSDGTTEYVGYWRPRIQVRDAAFSLRRTKTQSVYFVDHERDRAVGERAVTGKAARGTFDDARTWWYAQAPEAGVKLPRLGVRIKVKAMSSDVLKIWVDNKK